MKKIFDIKGIRSICIDQIVDDILSSKGEVSRVVRSMETIFHMSIAIKANMGDCCKLSLI